MIALSILLSSSVLISQDLPHIPFATFWTLTVALVNLSYSLILVTVVSRISRLLPEGFESTGVTMIISTSNISFSFGQYFSSVLADSYGVYGGYYGRIKGPQEILIGMITFVISLAPCLLKAA